MSHNRAWLDHLDRMGRQRDLPSVERHYVDQPQPELPGDDDEDQGPACKACERTGLPLNYFQSCQKCAVRQPNTFVPLDDRGVYIYE